MSNGGMPDRLEHAHTRAAIRERLAAGPRHSYLRDFVYGGIDGAVTTFAIVSGVVGAELSPRIILILGTANLLADGLSMAAGNYLATRAEHEEGRHAETIEHRHIAVSPEGERAEVREIFRQRGHQEPVVATSLVALGARDARDRRRGRRGRLRDRRLASRSRGLTGSAGPPHRRHHSTQAILPPPFHTSDSHSSIATHDLRAPLLHLLAHRLRYSLRTPSSH
jgi:hypothetical protein